MRAGVMCSGERPAASARLPVHAWIRGPMTTSTSASTNSTGTTSAKTFSGRCSSREAPSIEPASDAGSCQRKRFH